MKKTLCILIAVALLVSTMPIFASADVGETKFEPKAVSDWAKEEISLAYENNLIPDVLLDKDLTLPVNRGEIEYLACV